MLAFLTLGLFLWRRSVPNAESATKQSRPDRVADSAPVAVSGGTPTAATTEPRVAQERSAPGKAVPGSTTESADFSAAIMRHPEIQLTSNEWSALLAVYVETSKQRARYEATICTARDVSPDERVISIPKYSAEGAKLQEEMYRGFASVLGAERTTALREAVGSEFYIRNFGFGDAEQSIDVKLVSNLPQSAYYQIKHSVTELSIALRDGSGAVRKTALNVNGVESVLPINGLGSYAAFVNLFPVGA